MPTINPNLSNGKLIVIRVATTAIGLLLVSLSSRQCNNDVVAIDRAKVVYICVSYD